MDISSGLALGNMDRLKTLQRKPGPSCGRRPNACLRNVCQAGHGPTQRTPSEFLAANVHEGRGDWPHIIQHPMVENRSAGHAVGIKGHHAREAALIRGWAGALSGLEYVSCLSGDVGHGW